MSDAKPYSDEELKAIETEHDEDCGECTEVDDDGNTLDSNRNIVDDEWRWRCKIARFLATIAADRKRIEELKEKAKNPLANFTPSDMWGYLTEIHCEWLDENQIGRYAALQSRLERMGKLLEDCLFGFSHNVTGGWIEDIIIELRQAIEKEKP